METFIPAKKAKFGHGMFDSRLDLTRVDKVTNAKLILELKVNLVFVDPTHTHHSSKVIKRHGKSYAIDGNHRLFEIVDWTSQDIEDKKDEFKFHGELFWSWNFWLQHVKRDYTGLDKSTDDMGAIRPAVDCELSIDFTDKGAHTKIFVFNLKPDATAYLDGKGHEHAITKKDSLTWRSDSKDYDSLDWQGADVHLWLKKTSEFVDVHHDTIGHELGHAINQEHILDLKYNKNRRATANADKAYLGKTKEDAKNVMGWGDVITEDNAISWRERLAQHTRTKPSDWRVSMGRVAPRALSVFELVIP
jgi:hypothetical protein